MKSRECSVAWDWRFYPPRAVFYRDAKPRSKKLAGSCWPTCGELLLCHESEIKQSRFQRRSKSISTMTERFPWKDQRKTQLETSARHQGKREGQSRFTG